MQKYTEKDFASENNFAFAGWNEIAGSDELWRKHFEILWKRKTRWKKYKVHSAENDVSNFLIFLEKKKKNHGLIEISIDSADSHWLELDTKKPPIMYYSAQITTNRIQFMEENLHCLMQRI